MAKLIASIAICAVPLFFPILFSNGVAGISLETSSNVLVKCPLFLSCLIQRGTRRSVYVARDADSQYYSDLNFQWNYHHGIIHPLGYVVPENVADVQNAVRCGKKFGARLVPKSGGHSVEKYGFGDSDSVVLDLHKLSKVKVNKAQKTAWVGGGTLLGPLSYWLWQLGKFGIPAGDCHTLGVGGITQGGGHGFWFKRFGMTLDRVLGLEMVDANGDVRIVNESTNKDLFWALRGGGGGNFGVVTKFQYRVFDASNLIATSIKFEDPFDQVEKVFDVWQTWNYDERFETTFTYGTINSNGTAVSVYDFNLTKADIDGIKERFTLASTKTTIISDSYIEFTATQANPPVNSSSELLNINHRNDSKQNQRMKSYFTSKMLSKSEISDLKQICAQMPTGVNLEFKGYGGAVNRVGAAATAFVHRNALWCIAVNIKYHLAKNRTGVDNWVQQFDKFALTVLDNGESYQNYPDEDLTSGHEYLRRYYGSNLDRLIRVKRKVDPDNYFRFQQSIPTVNPFER